MAKQRIVIEVSGGVVQNVITEEQTDILLKDYDNIEGGDCPNGVLYIETVSPDGVADLFEKYNRE